MAMGPFRMGDLAGNDVGWYIRKRRYVEKPHLKYSRVADALCEQGRFGQKTGAGWYRYEAGKRDAIRDPAVEELITAYSARDRRHAPDRSPDEEIVERCIFALVNEGAQDPRGGDRAARLGPRRRLPLRLRLPGLAWRADALRRRGRPLQRGPRP